VPCESYLAFDVFSQQLQKNIAVTEEKERVVQNLQKELKILENEKNFAAEQHDGVVESLQQELFSLKIKLDLVQVENQRYKREFERNARKERKKKERIPSYFI
jgi:alpha-galactosidase/6-phospho-beta-glucosidase family protein